MAAAAAVAALAAAAPTADDQDSTIAAEGVTRGSGSDSDSGNSSNQVVVADSSTPARLTRSASRARPSQADGNNHLNGNSNSDTGTLINPSNKSLGKRRAVSPIHSETSEDAAPSASSTPVTQRQTSSHKRRRLGEPGSTAALTASQSSASAYNLRSRGTNTTADHIAGGQEHTSTNSTPFSTSSSPAVSSPLRGLTTRTARMPRKSSGGSGGSRGGSNNASGSGSLRAKAAANAAIQAANASFGSSSGSAARANSNPNPSPSTSATRSSKRQRDLQSFDVEGMVGDMETDESYDEDVDQSIDDDDAPGPSGTSSTTPSTSMSKSVAKSRQKDRTVNPAASARTERRRSARLGASDKPTDASSSDAVMAEASGSGSTTPSGEWSKSTGSGSKGPSGSFSTLAAAGADADAGEWLSAAAHNDEDVRLLREGSVDSVGDLDDMHVVHDEDDEDHDHDDDDPEGVDIDDEDDEDDDIDEDDEIGLHGLGPGDDDLMDDDIDAPLTFDADGNLLSGNGTTLEPTGSTSVNTEAGTGASSRSSLLAANSATAALLDALAAGIPADTMAAAAAAMSASGFGSRLTGSGSSSGWGSTAAGTANPWGEAAAGASTGQTGQGGDDHAGGNDEDDDDADDEGRAERENGRGFDAFAASLRGFSGVMSGMSNRLRTMLTDLRNKTDASVRMVALQELSELLSMSTEDTLAGYFSVDAFVKELVSCLKNGGGSTDLQAQFDTSGDMDEDMMAALQAAANADNGPGENVEEMQLLACRCLANLIEAMPHTAHNIVGNGAVPVLCSKLFEITFIDLAEQTISTLEKLSEEMPNAIVRDGGLSALLGYLDFFSTHVQRNALTAVAHCCNNLSIEAFESVREAMPILRNVLSSYPDRKLVEQACLATTRIVESYRHHPDKLEILLTADLLTAITALLIPGGANSTVDSSTHPKILKLLSTAAKSSPEIAMSLIDKDIGTTLYQMLTGTSPPLESEGLQGIKKHLEMDDMLVLNNLVHRSKDVVQETLALTSELMPALPRDGIFDPKAHMHRSSRSKVKKEDLTPANADASGTSNPAQPSNSNATSTSAGAASTSTTAPNATTSTSTSTTRSSRNVKRTSSRRSVLESSSNEETETVVKREEETPALDEQHAQSSQPSALNSSLRARESAQERRIELINSAYRDNTQRKVTLHRFFALLLPTLLDAYSASVGVQVRSKTFQCMLKIVQFCSAEYLPEILTIVPMASFLGSCCNANDQLQLVVDALMMTELLLTKVPDTYQYYFRREGVMCELEKMAEKPLVLVKSKKTSSSASGTPTASTPTGNTGGAATPTDDGGDAGDLGTRLAPQSLLATAVASKTYSNADAFYADSITLRARHLRKLLAQSAQGDGSLKADSALNRIRGLVAVLDEVSTPGLSHAKARTKADDALRELADLFTNENAMSSFEMQEGGLIGGLLRFATSGTPETLSNPERKQLIMNAFMINGASPSSALSFLVKRLQEALGKAEKFEVVSALPSSSDSRQNPAAMLARQIKIRLVSAEGAAAPKGIAQMVISIHAIATFQALNDYLRPKLVKAYSAQGKSQPTSPALTPSAGGGSGSSRLSGVLAALAAATGMHSAETEAAIAALSSSRTAPAASTSAISTPASSSRNPPSIPSEPVRRRSSRLSARAGASASSASAADTSVNSATQDVSTTFGGADEADESNQIPPSDLSAPATAEAAEDRPVNVEMASDGSRINVSTPDGTRVQTPVPPSSSSTEPSVAASVSGSGSGVPVATRSYAAALKTAPSDWHLTFSMNGHEVDMSQTIFGGVYQHELRSGNPNGVRGMWHQVYTVTYTKHTGSAQDRKQKIANAASETDLPAFLTDDLRQANILRLLAVLHQVNLDYAETKDGRSLTSLDAAAAMVPANVFVNNKLTAKLNRQLEEPMIVASHCLPDWTIELPVLFPFLFPFETRYVYLQSTSFGFARLMQKWLQAARSDANPRHTDQLMVLGRLQRQKVRISRARLFESATKVFELYGSSKALLEVEYFDEVGTGLGPTLEFYSLLSKEFRRRSLKLWRDNDTSVESDYTQSPAGLFPAPISETDLDTEAGRKRLTEFKTLGAVVAKALMDSRIVDLPFSRLFVKLILDQPIVNNVATIKLLDPVLAQSLERLAKYIEERQVIEAADIGEENIAAAVSEITVDGAKLEDLSLDFILPGYDIELKLGGRDIALTLDNLPEYLELVIDWTLQRGVKPFVERFKQGFSDVFPIRDLHTFFPDELIRLFGDEEEDWTAETIGDAIKADHGYSLASPAIANFVSIVSKFEHDMRRQALSFFTGASRLPIGGFGGLNPPLTVVRKPADAGLTPDDVLPSVMTCANFVKMPEYSSREVMEERLVKAILEGGGAFHLS